MPHVPTIEDLLSTVAELERENDFLREEAQFLDSQLAEAEAELDRLVGYGTAAEIDQHVEELEAQIEQLQSENSELSTELERIQVDTEQSSSDEEPFYLASSARQHFHRPGCKWALCISDGMRVELGSHREAVEAGLRPCKTCRA